MTQKYDVVIGVTLHDGEKKGPYNKTIGHLADVPRELEGAMAVFSLAAEDIAEIGIIVRAQ